MSLVKPLFCSTETAAAVLQRQEQVFPHSAGETRRSGRFPPHHNVHQKGDSRRTLSLSPLQLSPSHFAETSPSNKALVLNLICCFQFCKPLFLQLRSDQDEVRHLTSGDWEVTKIVAYDENNQIM